MNHVIIGAGPAGVVAAETIRKLDPTADIVLISNEAVPPYSRMAIPYLLRQDIDEAGTYLRKDAQHFAAQRIELVPGQVARVDPMAKELTLNSIDSGDSGEPDVQIHYDKLLVATGSRPITPPIPGIDHARVTSCWTLADARTIAAGIQPGAEVVLIGAGFIGCIILEALVSAGAKLTVVEMGDRMVPRMLDATCGELLAEWCRAKGVAVITAAQVERIEEQGAGVVVQVSGGRNLTAQLVICAAGVESNAEFLADSGVNLVNGAVLVDESMRAHADIYAAGDVACGRDFSTNEYSVQAIQPTAVEHGRVAANNMVCATPILHRGSMLMNVLDTMGLVSTSYGQWQGVEGGETATLVDAGNYRYMQLQFADERLIGANTLGLTQHIGVLRGLIQGRFRLGAWHARLIENPLLLMEAYLAVTQGIR